MWAGRLSYPLTSTYPRSRELSRILMVGFCRIGGSCKANQRDNSHSSDVTSPPKHTTPQVVYWLIRRV